MTTPYSALPNSLKLQSYYHSSLALTAHKDIDFCGCDVQYSYLPSLVSPLKLINTVRFKNDLKEEQWTVWQADSGLTTRGCGVEGHSGLCACDSEPLLAPPAYVW